MYKAGFGSWDEFEAEFFNKTMQLGKIGDLSIANDCIGKNITTTSHVCRLWPLDGKLLIAININGQIKFNRLYLVYLCISFILVRTENPICGWDDLSHISEEYNIKTKHGK